MNVLITIGSMSEKKFTRLFKAVDQLCKENILDPSRVKAQVGFDQYHSQYYKCFDMVSDEEFKRMIDEADLIISHAGTGTVISCIKKGKKVIVFPRRAKYDEHYDDHQLELADLFARQNYVLVANDVDELRKCVQKIDDFHPSKFVSNNEKMNRIIIDFIER